MQKITRTNCQIPKWAIRKYGMKIMNGFSWFWMADALVEVRDGRSCSEVMIGDVRIVVNLK
jgi:hypothetical protein